MAVWLVRAGARGEFEQKFVQENRIYVTWDSLDVNVAAMRERSELFAAMEQRYPGNKPKTIHNNVSQVWPFAHEMKKGDLIVLPLKTQRTIQIGEVAGDYQFEPAGPNPFFHWRAVKWVGESIPRANFGKDLLNTFGAFLTICRVRTNNAEARLATMRKNGWQAETVATIARGSVADAEASEGTTESDLEELALDRIARVVRARFKDHDLTRLVEAILRAQGYTTYRSPEGADGGADILAGGGELGFGAPRLCVEVKSSEGPTDRPTVDKLLGAMTKFGAQEGLFVSWGGFKSNVQKELAPSFFRLRLWGQAELFDALFAYYEKLDPDIKVELPLKRIWTVAAEDEE